MDKIKCPTPIKADAKGSEEGVKSDSVGLLVNNVEISWLSEHPSMALPNIGIKNGHHILRTYDIVRVSLSQAIVL